MWWTIWGGVVPVAALVASPTIAEVPFGVAIFAAAFFIAVLGAAMVPYLRYRRWRYEIRERDLFLSHGSWFYVLTLIPFDRIQYVAFKLMQLVVYTAAGKAARIPGLDPDEAEALREELAKVAGTESV
jgi:uncharacterized protein